MHVIGSANEQGAGPMARPRWPDPVFSGLSLVSRHGRAAAGRLGLGPVPAIAEEPIE